MHKSLAPWPVRRDAAACGVYSSSGALENASTAAEQPHAIAFRHQLVRVGQHLCFWGIASQQRDADEAVVIH